MISNQKTLNNEKTEENWTTQGLFHTAKTNVLQCKRALWTSQKKIDAKTKGGKLEKGLCCTLTLKPLNCHPEERRSQYPKVSGYPEILDYPKET